MSKSAFELNPPSAGSTNASQWIRVTPNSGQHTEALNATATPSPAVAGPSTSQAAGPKRTGSEVDANTRPKKARKRMEEECEIMRETAHRFTASLAMDHIAVLYPDTETPFEDTFDVVRRLLPYHVFQHPKEDLDMLTKGRKEKNRDNTSGKENDELRREITETKFALQCFKRRKALQDRFRRAKVKSGKRAAPDDMAYALAQVVLEADSAETSAMGSELRNARIDYALTKRAGRPAYYSTQPGGYYRAFQYAYTQPYPSSMPVTASAPLASTPAPAVPTLDHLPLATTAIPVQLPVASLPALHALGIIPVPATSLPAPDQPQPPAVMRGSSANGTMLQLEINVSLLQQAQMSGLAMMLNRLTARRILDEASKRERECPIVQGNN